MHHNLKAEMRITVVALKVMENISNVSRGERTMQLRMDECNKITHSFNCMASRRKQLHNSINVFDCHF